MKIGILTQPLHANYGGLIQNYALQQGLIRAGHEVETLDQQNRRVGWLRLKLYRMKLSFFHLFAPSIYKRPRYNASNRELAIIRKNTNHFIKTYIKHSQSIRSFEDFKSVAKYNNYDAYVVGSDQCWRPCYNSFLSSMFLDFLKGEKVKRIAYAASFGTDKWEYTAEQTEQCAALAQMFDFVSVREDSGIKLCKDYFGVEATHVLDPTMLLTKEDYICLIEAENTPNSLGSLFNYILDPNQNKTDFIHRAANERGLIPFQVLPMYQAETRTKADIKSRIEDCVFPGVTTWLRAFMDAEMTIVDSFHGMVFSIIFNKPFWVIGNVNRGMSRFTSLLKVFHLEDRLLDANQLQKVDINRPIDWSSVNAILEQKRNECKNLLLSQLSK